MKNTFSVAFCGLISALALGLMLITSIIPVGTYAFPCFAGMLLVAVVIEIGAKWAYSAFSAIAILSLFLAGDKEAVLYFITFFGFYPILKGTIERLKSRAIQYVIKYAVFNVCIITSFFIGKFVLMIPDEEFTIFGIYIPWVLLIIGNLFFICYDMCVTVMLRSYIFNIRNKIFKGK